MVVAFPLRPLGLYNIKLLRCSLNCCLLCSECNLLLVDYETLPTTTEYQYCLAPWMIFNSFMVTIPTLLKNVEEIVGKLKYFAVNGPL